MPKWFHIMISVLLALLAIGFSILICGKHHWGYIPMPRLLTTDSDD